MAGREVKNGLYKGKDAIYHFCFKQDGKMHRGSTGCHAAKAAQEWLRMHRQGLSQKKVGIRTADNIPTLKKALADWEIASVGVVTAKYAKQKGDRIRNHFQPELVLPLHLLDTATMEQARQRYLTGKFKGNGYQNEKGRGVGGWNSLLRDLRALYSWAVKRELIEKVPFSMSATKVQEDPDSKAVIWPELAAAFIAAVDRWPTTRFKGHQDTRTAVWMMLLLGLREDEAITSRWEWLDKRNGTYTVGDAKNRRLRTLPVPAVLMTYIESHHTRPDNGKGLILPMDDEGNPHTEGLTSKCVAACSAVVGIKDMTPHRVRATYATACFEAGVDLNQIQILLGHENQATTMGYVVVRSRPMGEAQDKVAALLIGSPGVHISTVKLTKDTANAKDIRNRAASS
jgi:integrase